MRKLNFRPLPRSSVLWFSLLFFFAMHGHLDATQPSPGAGATTWTLDDLILAERADDWTLSRDGLRAVWVRTSVESVGDSEQAVANLWLSELATGESFPLTRGQDTAASPAFSPDGTHIAFLSDRPLPGGKGGAKEAKLGKQQIWLLPLRGGDAYPLTRFDRNVSSFRWRDDASLVAAAQESPSAWEAERKEKKDKAVVVDDAENEPPVRLFLVPLEGKARRLTDNRDWIDSLEVSPDGAWAAVTAQQSLHYNFDQITPPQTFLVSLETGRRERILADSPLLPFELRWAPDGSGFYFLNEHTRHPKYRMATITEAHFYGLESRASEPVAADWERGLEGSYAAVPGGIAALLVDGVRNRPARILRQGSGWKRQDLSGTHAANIDDWRASGDGTRLVYQYSTAVTPPQWFGAKLSGDDIREETRLTKLNARYEGKPTGRAEAIRWTGARGETVEGMLHWPLDWGGDGDGTRPLVVDIHGGPASRDRDSWDQRWGGPLLLWRQRGAFVLQVNYHGSSGYGLDWVESIGEGKYYEFEPTDILQGVDRLIADGLVDPGRLGCAGWSNGGILTADLITRTGRFRAASVGAADVEWFSDWGNVDFGAAFDNYYFGGTPWEEVETYKEKSPFFRLDQVTTPTIIFTGTADRAVPPHQSWSLFRALQYIGKAPARLVLFPGEPHGLQQISHQRRKVEEEVAWFDRYLFESPDRAEPAIREDSPLAALIGRWKADRHGEAFGRFDHKILVPETVHFGGIEVGRFEVTRAQFAAFEPTATPGPSQENLPAVGLSFERALEYAGWLSKTTGRSYRLPTLAEARRLRDLAGTGGNTLDRWAGYTPNPEDARRLKAALPEAAELLLPAGSFPGAGEGPVFDLDGNAAEWATGEDGRGEPSGPSADRPTDPRSGDVTEDPRYIGFRVVLDGDAGTD